MTVPTPVADVLHRTLFGNVVEAWLTAALTAAILFLVLLVVRRVLVTRVGSVAARTTIRFDDVIVAMVKETRTWTCLAFAVLVGLSQLQLGSYGEHVPSLIKLVALWQLALWGGAAIGFWMEYHLTRRTSEGDRASVAMISAMGVGAKVILWVLVLIAALTWAFTINIAPFITGLGVTGIAVALAVQNILGDVLAALAIVFDKPFDVGDSIGVDQMTGTVEHIGLKTTRLRSIVGDQIIIGNGDLLKSRIHNYRRMTQRRIVFTVGVAHDTPPDVLAEIPGVIKEVVSAQSPVRFDRSHVANLATAAIQIETVYTVLSADYTVYMNIQQAINLGLLQHFAAKNVTFAPPT